MNRSQSQIANSNNKVIASTHQEMVSEDFEFEYSGSENSCSSNYNESPDLDDSCPPRVTDDQDFDDNTHMAIKHVNS